MHSVGGGRLKSVHGGLGGSLGVGVLGGALGVGVLGGALGCTWLGRCKSVGRWWCCYGLEFPRRKSIRG